MTTPTPAPGPTPTNTTSPTTPTTPTSPTSPTSPASPTNPSSGRDVRAERTDIDQNPEVGGGGRREVEVRGAPSSGVVLARGLAQAAQRRAGTAPTPRLPEVELVMRRIRPDADRLTAYQQLVGEAVGDVVPAGFLHVLAFPLGTAMLARPDFPLPVIGMVHVANHVELRRPVLLGEELDAHLHAERLAPHKRGATVDVVAELAVGGDVVWRGVSTYLAKGVRLPDADAPDAGERPTFVPPTPTGQWRLGRDVGRRYATVSGDHNPIHMSALAARAFGFPGPIAHGMYTAARALADVGVGRGDAYTWEVEFASPVLLPSTVSVRVAPDDAGFTLAAWSRTGKLHLTGTVRPLS